MITDNNYQPRLVGARGRRADTIAAGPSEGCYCITEQSIVTAKNQRWATSRSNIIIKFALTTSPVNGRQMKKGKVPGGFLYICLINEL